MPTLVVMIIVDCETLHKLTSILVQVAGIASTLLMVRVNLDKYQEEEDIPFSTQIVPTVLPGVPSKSGLLEVLRD
ncbi:hypothetical protein PQX77_022166 [Marasmius sp. AFHP31]|nr:hypothetical protein PQX77_022166 [Marasmius sp. AFHP31]